MATAADLIQGSLRLIGQLAEGELPSNETYADSLTALNQLIEAWSISRLTVYALQDQSFSWTVSQSSRTIGPTGNFVGTRPIAVDESTYIVADGISYPLILINREQYNSIADKAVTSDYPMFMMVEATTPNMTLTVYPVPTAATTIHIMSVLELTQPAAITTALVIPPGYLRAFRFALACELAAEFGKEPPGWVMKTAAESRNAIERINAPLNVMSFPDALVRGNRSSNIYTGP